MTAAEAGKLLIGKNRILILTGAGLSAASGIPTFRGNDGLWIKEYKNCESPEEMATLEYFKKYPEEEWKWNIDFLELMAKWKPNAGHKAILKFQEFCYLKNQSPSSKKDLSKMKNKTSSKLIKKSNEKVMKKPESKDIKKNQKKLVNPWLLII